MNILITGGTGFIGSYVVRKMIELDHNVCVVTRDKTYLNRIESLRDKIEVVDIEEAMTQDCFFSRKIELIIHCATTYARDDSIETIQEVIESNILFPLRLIALAINAGVKFFINTDSYFNVIDKREYTVNDYMATYTLSKSQIGQWIGYIASTGKMHCVNMRLEHVYGMDDRQGKFIPFLLENFKRNSSSLELSEGMQRKDFIAVEDVVEAYACVISAMENGIISGMLTAEVGTGKIRTLREFVELIKISTKAETRLNWGSYSNSKNEVGDSVADNSFLRSLGWCPRIVEDEDVVKYFENV